VCDGRCMPEQEKNKLNDLIKEFARQAGFKVNWQHEDVQAIKMAQYKEFAELIVRECLDIVNRKEYSYHEADPLWETAQLIKERFGVEE
jgi:hypothetical protein